MHVAGFVLAGGASRRMGRDKALLEHQGQPWICLLADRVRAAAGNVTIIGPPERYAGLGYTVEGDRTPGLGPLGGLATALGLGRAPWNLVIACDLLHLPVELLMRLVRVTETADVDCVAAALPEGGAERGAEPLCAAYHARVAPLVDRLLESKQLKMRDFLAQLRVVAVPAADPRELANVNTPEDWAKHAVPVEPLRRVPTRS